MYKVEFTAQKSLRPFASFVRKIFHAKNARIQEGITMLVEYVQGALEKAEYKKLEDGSWFAEIPGFQGVWANGKTVEACRKELMDVLEEWLILKLRDGDPIPVVKGIEINIKEVATT